MRAPLLRLDGLTKAYPGVIANDDVSFEIGQGQMHALLGENGAGKSTLVKMIYGLVKPDKGQMTLRGNPLRPHNHQTRAAMVWQWCSSISACSMRWTWPKMLRWAWKIRPPARSGAAYPRCVRRIWPAAGPRAMGGRAVGRRTPACGNCALPAARSQAAYHG